MSNCVVITLGDPAGCGPLVTLKALQSFPRKKTQFIIIGDKVIFDHYRGFRHLKSNTLLIDVATKNSNQIEFGYPSRASGQASLNYLNTALRIVSKDKTLPLVTAPVSKEAIGKVLKGFCGHTEYLASFFKKKSVVMLMYSKKIKTALLTRHIDLKKVPRSITHQALADTITLLYGFLKKHCGIARPRIALASVNPHAGIDTFLGLEEKILLKGIARSKKKIYGPYPSDTLFTESKLKYFDCIICCYHDQGMIPFKLLSFRDGINVTVGLPIIRTSAAHGVAFDRIRENRPLMYTSMSKAIQSACNFAYGV